MNDRMVKADDVIWRQIGDEIVIIRDNGLSTHVLNKTAGYIWEMCDGTCDVNAITDNICERFDVPTSQASADVIATINQLTEIGLLSHVEV